MIRLVRAELLKIRTTRLWLGLLIGGALLTALGAIATLSLGGTAQGAQAGITPVRTLADVRDLVYTANTAGIFAVVLGATVITTEYRSGTIAGTFLATPLRWPVITAKVLASAITGFVFGVVCALIPVVSAEVYLVLKGYGTRFGGSVGLAVAVVGLVGGSSGAIGAGVGSALRSQLVAILVVLGWMLVVEPLAGGLVPDLLPWLPFSGAQASLSQQTPGLFAPGTGGLLLAGYIVLAMAAGIAVTRRRDVG